MSAPIRMGAGAPHGQATAARERRSTSARSALRFPRLAGLAGLASFDLIIIAAFVPGYMLSYRTQPSVIAGPLADLGFGLLALSGLPTALCLASYATLVRRLRCLPPWTAWLAGAGALAHVLIAASFVSHGGFLSLESSVIVWVPATFFAWIFATSAALLRKPTSAAVS